MEDMKIMWAENKYQKSSYDKISRVK